MRTITLMLVFSISIFMAFAQEAIKNFGNLKLHENASIGFHTNLINDGTITESKGLAGFYNTEETLFISGTNTPQFYNVESAVINNLYLEVNLEILNSMNYISGHISTPKDFHEISLDFLDNANFNNATNSTYTDGYVSYTGSTSFSYPIGHNENLRPLITATKDSNFKLKAAYFNENPNNPSTFSENFNTEIKNQFIKKVTLFEFWDFNGDTETQVTLTWNENSNVIDLVEDLENVRVVGWHTENGEWTDLGNTEFTGTFSEGTVKSNAFTPNDYDIITIGELDTEVGSETFDTITVTNVITPNNDSKNDTFFVKNIEKVNNTVTIFNRWGRIVYETTNYKNDWDGISQGTATIDKGSKLPTGTYFYVIKLTDLDEEYAGYLYIQH